MGIGPLSCLVAVAVNRHATPVSRWDHPILGGFSLFFFGNLPALANGGRPLRVVARIGREGFRPDGVGCNAVDANSGVPGPHGRVFSF